MQPASLASLRTVRRFLPRDPRVEEPYRLTPQTALRIAILGAIAIALFAVLFLRLWALQVISGERYLQEAQNNQVRTARVEARRGHDHRPQRRATRLERRRRPSVQLWPADAARAADAERAAMLGELAKLLGLKLRRDPGGARERTATIRSRR